MNEEIEILNKETNPTVSIEGNKYIAVPLMVETFIDAKEMIRFIKSVETMVRSSIEYKSLIKFMKTELSLNNCSYLNTLDTDTVSVELHHTPYNLHQIVEIVIAKHETLGLPFTTFKIAQEVIELHYKNYIGLCSLSKTIHELAHSDERFFIHKDLIIGDVESFYNLYKEYMSEDLKSVYKSWKKYSDDNPADAKLTLELFDSGIRDDQLGRIGEINSAQYKPLIKEEKISIPQLEFEL